MVSHVVIARTCSAGKCVCVCVCVCVSECVFVYVNELGVFAYVSK